MTARASTETAAANLALGHLGQPALADLAHDSSLRARACRLFFGGARDAILREKWWSFAKGWVTPAADTVESAGPLKTRFVMPAECLRVRYIDGVDEQEWDMESGDVEDGVGVTLQQTVLVTNITAPLVAYTRRIEAVRLWDPVFLDGFAYELASRCAGKLGRSTSKANGLHAQAMEAIDSAAAIDSKEQSRKTVTRTPSWIAARRGVRTAW